MPVKGWGRRARRVGMGMMAVALAATTAWAADDARVEALEREVRELRAQVAALSEGKGEGSADAAALEEIRRRIEVLTREIENLKLGEAAPVAKADEGGQYGLGPAASKVYEVRQGVSIGGYGEFLYERFDDTAENGSPSGRTDQADALRVVLYTGYKFNDRMLFNSEIEYEHGTTGSGAEAKGEVSVEFAYLDFLLGDALGLRAGLLLVPVGFVNELHEPPIFLGTRRPLVERNIIPTTWRELGVGVVGETGPVEYRAYVTTSLGSTGLSASGIRGGRTSGSRTPAEDLALSGRVDWTPFGGLTVGASLFTGDTGQGRTTPGGEELDANVTLWDAHAEYRWRGLQVRALYANVSVDDVAELNAANALAGTASVGEEQYGWYGEVGYDLLAGRSRHAVIPFVRYERWNTQDRVPAGFAVNPANDNTLTTVGVSWKPIPNIAVKADWNKAENEARTGVDQINVALGFLF
jgi:hypothetical protein